MREKELRLALVCYGGISLAVYMHGVTKEVWHLARASRLALDRDAPVGGVADVYRELLDRIAAAGSLRLRVVPDILTGASAGGINAAFLARALAYGESLEPLTDLWLTRADVTELLDPDARPVTRFTKFWAQPLAWWAARAGGEIRATVERSARAEVGAKLSQFIRARWFEPPFGGASFCHMLLDAFDAMASGPKGPVLIPGGLPLDLALTATDYSGEERTMRLNSPPIVRESEHRVTLAFRHAVGSAAPLDPVALTYAARASASFPGAFPPFRIDELDRVLGERGEGWDARDAFLQRAFGGDLPYNEARVLIDGSVLANAPFGPAVAALRERRARREVDRRVVYIDPKPGHAAIGFGGRAVDAAAADAPLPGFFGTILKALSDLPRSQPIRDNVEALAVMSRRIATMRRIVAAMRPEVEERVESALGLTFFLDRPTPARLVSWRRSVQDRAREEAGYGFLGYGHLKLAGTIEELARIVAAHDPAGGDAQLWAARLGRAASEMGADRLESRGKEAPAVGEFLRAHDVHFRIRRLSAMARRLDELAAERDEGDVLIACEDEVRDAIYAARGRYEGRAATDCCAGLEVGEADAADARELLSRIAARRDLATIDGEVDASIADALGRLDKGSRRALLYAYLGFAFYDAATLPLLQGQVEGEFDPILIDRISPDDAVALRVGGAETTLKGVQFNSFGAFFSRAFRENDYLWGRLHAAERLIAIVASSAADALDDEEVASLRRRAFAAILDEEASRLGEVADLIAQLRSEVAEGS